MTDAEFEKIWEDCKRRDERLELKWNNLPEEGKKRRREQYDPAIIERFTDDILD